MSFFDVIDVQKLREAFEYDSRNNWSKDTDYEVIGQLAYLFELAINYEKSYELIEEFIDSLYVVKSQPNLPQWKLWELYLRRIAEIVNEKLYGLRDLNAP